MELTPDQCTLIAATIPVLLLTLAVERKTFLGTRFWVFRVIWTLAVLAMGAATIVAFNGIQDGLSGFAGGLAGNGFLFGIGLVVGTLVMALLLPPEAKPRKRAAGRDPEQEHDE